MLIKHTAHLLGTIGKVVIGELLDGLQPAKLQNIPPPKKKDNKYFDNNRFHWFVLDSFISLIYILLGNLTPPVSVKGKAVQRKKGASIEREDGMWSA